MYMIDEGVFGNGKTFLLFKYSEYITLPLLADTQNSVLLATIIANHSH